MYWILAIFILIVIAGVIIGLTKDEEKEKARKAYQASLLFLKRHPANPDLREETLRLGRRYAELSRDSKGRTTFDEVALMNDINAACAHASVAPKEKSAPVSIEERLAKLSSLHQQGMLDDEEYHARRQQILDEI